MILFPISYINRVIYGLIFINVCKIKNYKLSLNVVKALLSLEGVGLYPVDFFIHQLLHTYLYIQRP